MLFNIVNAPYPTQKILDYALHEIKFEDIIEKTIIKYSLDYDPETIKKNISFIPLDKEMYIQPRYRFNISTSAPDDEMHQFLILILEETENFLIKRILNDAQKAYNLVIDIRKK